MENIQCGQPAYDRWHNGGEQNRERVHIALVKNCEDHKHDENCRKQQQREGLKQLSEYERLTLEGSLHRWVLRLDLRYGILDVLRSVANRRIRQQVEIESDTGELVEMVLGLRANNFLRCCYNTKRNKAGHVTRSRGDGSPTRSARAEIAARATADVKIVQVIRVRALF